MDLDSTNAWDGFSFGFIAAPPLSSSKVDVDEGETKKRARREVIEDDSAAVPLSLSPELPPSPSLLMGQCFQDLSQPSLLLLHDTDRRLHDLQGQLIAANERVHAMEAFIAEQEAWLEEERLDHAATDRRLRAVETELGEERIRGQIQATITAALETELQELSVKACQESQLVAEFVDREVAKVRETAARQMEQVKEEAARQVEQVKEEAARQVEQVEEEASQRVAQLRRDLEDEHETEIAQITREHIEEATAAQDELDVATQRVDDLREQLEEKDAELEQARKDVHEACCEVSRLGEAMATTRQPMGLGRKMREALQKVFTIACQLGDRQADSPALTDHIDYAKWRASLTALAATGIESMDDLDPSLIHGAATVIGTLVPILYALYVEVGASNAKLIAEHDRLVGRCKELEGDLVKCECPKFKAYIAKIEKEMEEAEQLIHQQNGVNKDLHLRVLHRNSLDQVKIDGASLLQNLVMAQEQKRQLQQQVQSLERTLASVRSSGEKLQTQKGELEAKLLEAEKQIPPPRALLWVQDLGENVQELRRSLGPLVDDVDCAQCVLYLGKAREADRRCSLAEQSVVEEQRRLVLLTQDNKRVLESKSRELEAAANVKVAEEKKKTAKAERRLAEAEAKLREGGKMSEAHRADLDAKDKEMQDHLVVCQRKLSAKNAQIEELQGAAMQSKLAKNALSVMSHLLITHQFSSVPNAERVKSAHEDVIRALHAREPPVQITNAFQRLENELRDFALWLGSDKVKEEWRQQRRIITAFAAQIEKTAPALDALPLAAEGKQALSSLREAWKYARKTLSIG